MRYIKKIFIIDDTVEKYIRTENIHDTEKNCIKY